MQNLALFCMAGLVGMTVGTSTRAPATWAAFTAATDGAAAAGVASALRDGTVDMHVLIPESLDAWRRASDDAFYDRETIFRYMNGAGEIYLSFAFQQLLVREFAGPDDQRLTVEFYDMGFAGDAFGVFTRNRQAEEAGIGQGSQYRSGHLNFWKDRFFVTVFAGQDNESARQAAFALGRAIAANIPDEGLLPAILAFLPPEDLISWSIRYFHKHTDLNQHYFLADENILDLDARTEAVMANYQRGEDFLYLLLIHYPGEAAAKKAYARFRKHYLPEARDGASVQTEDGSWTATKRTGQHIMAVFDAASEQRSQALLMAAAGRVEGTRP